MFLARFFIGVFPVFPGRSGQAEGGRIGFARFAAIAGKMKKALLLGARLSLYL